MFIPLERLISRMKKWDIFVMRILFHGCLLTLYPLIVVYLLIGFVGIQDITTWSLSGIVLAGVTATITISLQLIM